MAEKTPNKIKFGLRNVHIFPIESRDEETGKPTYGEVKRFPGAVELSLTPRGDMTEFYADDLVYYAQDNNQGYDGSFETALIPSWFSEIILGEQRKNGVLIESSNDKGKDFAMAFQFDGDVHETMHLLYNCSSSRPDVAGATKTETADPQTQTLTFVASARPGDYLVKARTDEATPEEVLANWYKEVFEPTEEEVEG